MASFDIVLLYPLIFAEEICNKIQDDIKQIEYFEDGIK